MSERLYPGTGPDERTTFAPYCAFDIPADLRELHGRYDVEATARRVRNFRYAEEWMMMAMGGWVATIPEVPVKTGLGKIIWESAKAADELGKRLPELRCGRKAQAASESPNDGFAAFIQAVTGEDGPIDSTRMALGIGDNPFFVSEGEAVLGGVRLWLAANEDALLLGAISMLMGPWLHELNEATTAYYAPHVAEGYILSFGASLLVGLVVLVGVVLLCVRAEEVDAALLSAFICLYLSLALLHVQHAAPLDTGRGVVGVLAGDGAGLAPDAAVEVDHHAPTVHDASLRAPSARDSRTRMMSAPLPVLSVSDSASGVTELRLPSSKSLA